MIRSVHEAFGTVLWVVCFTAGVVALVALISTRKTWQDYGKDGLLMDFKPGPSDAWGTPTGRPGTRRGDQADDRGAATLGAGGAESRFSTSIRRSPG